MLPSTGYFRKFDCPFYESSCTRPYCHYRHRKKAPEREPQPAPQPEIPTYKPTPKSELANAAKSHIPISYVPDLVIRSDRVMRPLPPFNIEKPTYKPTPISILETTNALSKCEYVPSSVEDNKKKEGELGDLSKDFNYIDEILKEEKEERKSGEKDRGSKSDKSDDRHRKDKYSSRSSSTSKHKDKEKEKSRSSEKKKDEEKRHSSKDEEKRHASDKNKDDKSKRHSDRKHRDDDSKHKEESKRRKEDEKRSKEDEKRSKENRSKEKKTSGEDEKKKDDRRKKSDDKKHDDKRKHEDKRHRSRSEDKKHRDKRDSKKKKPEETVPKVTEVKKEEVEEYEATTINVPSPTESLYNDIEYEDNIEEECYKIFNEYKPTEPAISIEDIVKDKTEEAPSYVPTCKKRIAYDRAEQSGSKVSFNKPKPVTNVALVMANRMKLARQAQANNEVKNLMTEMQHGIKRRISTETVETIKKVQRVEKEPTEILNGKPKSLVDEILSGRSISSKPRRIAPVQNVNSIQRAKARIDEMARQRAISTFKTPSQTLSRGNKRLAHIPEASLSDIPDVLQSERSKLPVNVRTRYLTMLADECVKLYVSKEDAYQRALNEEVKCYERCSALATYRNSAMLAVNRLRKEAQERDKSGMGPIQAGENSERNVDSPFHGKKFYDNICGFILTEEELILHGYPREGDVPGKAVINREMKPNAYDHLEENERVCCRCHKLYKVDDDGIPLNPEDCNYHPLRKRTLRGERKYLCCKSTEDTGCVISNTHVSEVSYDRELEGYQSTMEPSGDDDPRNTSVYALDCEMCYTTIGLELTRVTIVDTNLRTIYESLVKPLNPIIDYNTRFSGITKEQMDKTSTSILQVQANILHLCNSKTILMGHSLESDLKALKIIHSSVIDTAVMFPHKFGLPHKRALRALASDYLKKIIQNDVGGHDSAEDALTCMELVIWKVKEDLKVRGMKI